MPRAVRAGLAGAAGVGLALAVAELLASFFDGVPSLVTAVAAYVVPFTPPALEDWAISTFGTNDKGVLALGAVTVSLLIGAVAGVLGDRERSNAQALFAGFAVLGIAAAIGRPLTSPVLTILVTVVAAGLGYAALSRMLGLLPVASDDTSTEEANASRRRFMTTLATVTVAAGIGAALARNVMAPPPIDADSLTLPEPERGLPDPADAASLEVDGLTPLFVPNDEFYRIDTALSVPQIDPNGWTLRIHGMVDREVELTYSDLLDMRLVEHDATIACVSNEVGGGLVGNARWTGVPLYEVLDLAGVKDGATQIVGRSIDRWTAGFPTEAAYDGRQAMVVVGMNGETLPARHGFPARLIVPGLYGYVSATKWLTEIQLTTWEDFDAYWVPRGWSKEGPIKTQSRIDVPRRGASVQPGQTVVAGVAWAPQRGIQTVELRVDDGAWKPCELSEPLNDDAWVQWKTTVELTPGRHRLQVRATDGTGTTQPQTPVPPRPNGAEGWHDVSVSA